MQLIGQTFSLQKSNDDKIQSKLNEQSLTFDLNSTFLRYRLRKQMQKLF